MTKDGPHELLKRHAELTAHLRDVVRQCTTARDGGELKEARELLAQAEAIQEELQRLEQR
jgi:hypothetical protein